MNAASFQIIDHQAECAYKQKLKTLLETTVAQLTFPISITSFLLGSGVITEISGSSVAQAHVHVTFADGVKKVYVLAKTQHITFTDSEVARIIADALAEDTRLSTDWTNYCSEYEANYHRGVQERLAAEALERQKRRENLEAEKELKQYEERKQRTLESFEGYGVKRSPVDTSNADFWYAIGWLASHVSTISAQLPDYLDAAFTKAFGTEAPRTLIDSHKKTSGGYAMKWDWSFTASLKKSKSRLPIVLMDYATESAVKISNTAFLWALVADFGFQFGKGQNVDQIRAHIPVEELKSFERGLAST